MSKLRIQDESGDRKYFTQVPNYITNHSTANDQALYLQMKRYAGEDGTCFATEETLCKKLGIGKKSYWRARDYLLKNGWIKFIGVTGGKTRPIKTYTIVDIWKLNIMEYEKISPERDISLDRDKSQKEEDKSQKQHKISLKRDIEEEPVLRRTIKEERGNFVPPSLEELIIYCKERQNKINPQSFLDFYDSKGWLIGKNKMKDWRAAVRTWENRDRPIIKDDYFLIVGNHKFKTKEDVESASRNGIIKWDNRDKKWVS
jgi:hypothetical protein